MKTMKTLLAGAMLMLSASAMAQATYEAADGTKYEFKKHAFLNLGGGVQYTATLFDKKEGDPRPNKLSFLLKPVRYQGRWYLTMADSDDRNTSRSKIRESQN